jgi:hypothetical protein
MSAMLWLPLVLLAVMLLVLVMVMLRQIRSRTRRLTLIAFYRLWTSFAYRAQLGLHISDSALEAEAKVRGHLHPALRDPLHEADRAYLLAAYGGEPVHEPFDLTAFWQTLRASLQQVMRQRHPNPYRSKSS